MATKKRRVPQRRWWVRWFATHKNGPFTLRTPWWLSGERCSDGAKIVCAALQADSDMAAMELVKQAHDNKNVDIEFSFVSERASDWDPFCDRFPRARWMKWPPEAP